MERPESAKESTPILRILKEYLEDELPVDVTHKIHGTGIFTCMWLILKVNVGKYAIHEPYG